MSRKPTVATLWGGIGGGMLGFVQAGFRPIWLSDDRDFVPEMYVHETWEKYMDWDWAKTKRFDTDPDWEDLDTLFEQRRKRNLDVLIGSPPCKRFSALGMRKKNRLEFDPNDIEYVRFLKAVNFIQPRVWVLENIPSLSKTISWSVEDTPDLFKPAESGNRDLNIYMTADQDRTPIISLPGYSAIVLRLNSKNYGVPQSRNRLYTIGVLGEMPEELSVSLGVNPGKKIKTVKGALEALVGVPNMEKSVHSDERIAGFAALKEGESYYGGPNNRRLYLDSPSPVVTSHRTQMIHPSEPRVLTVRECARLMGFPDEFIFMGPKTKQLDQAGCSITPQVAKYLGFCIAKYLKTL